MTTFADYINKVSHLNSSNNIAMHKWKKLKKKTHLIDASASRDNLGCLQTSPRDEHSIGCWWVKYLKSWNFPATSNIMTTSGH